MHVNLENILNEIEKIKELNITGLQKKIEVCNENTDNMQDETLEISSDRNDLFMYSICDDDKYSTGVVDKAIRCWSKC